MLADDAQMPIYLTKLEGVHTGTPKLLETVLTVKLKNNALPAYTCLTHCTGRPYIHSRDAIVSMLLIFYSLKMKQPEFTLI